MATTAPTPRTSRPTADAPQAKRPSCIHGCPRGCDTGCPFWKAGK